MRAPLSPRCTALSAASGVCTRGKSWGSLNFGSSSKDRNREGAGSFDGGRQRHQTVANGRSLKPTTLHGIPSWRFMRGLLLCSFAMSLRCVSIVEYTHHALDNALQHFSTNLQRDANSVSDLSQVPPRQSRRQLWPVRTLCTPWHASWSGQSRRLIFHAPCAASVDPTFLRA